MLSPLSVSVAILSTQEIPLRYSHNITAAQIRYAYARVCVSVCVCVRVCVRESECECTFVIEIQRDDHL